MWFDNDLFRLSYIAVVLVPLVLAIFSTNTTIVNSIPLIIGWSFLVTHANLMNDFVDKDRKLPLTGKYLLALSIIFLVFGFYLMMDMMLYPMIFVLLMFVHNFITSRRIYSDTPVQAVALTMPYFSLATNIDFNILGLIIGNCVTGLFTDRMMDEKPNRRAFKILKTLSILSLFGIFCFLIYLIFWNSYYAFLSPILLFVVGGLLIVLKGRLSFKTKVLIFYSNNVLLFYLIAVLASMGKFV